MMLNEEIIERVIDLHEKSYKLLQWINRSLNKGVLKFNVIHSAVNTSDATTEWIKRHYDNIPEEIRPPKNFIDEFSNLFLSYLTTSFELIKKPEKYLKSDCGCYCPVCSYLATANHLKTRKLSKKAQKSAVELKIICLTSIATEAEIALIDDEILSVLSDIKLKKEIALVTYCNELLRRTQFAGQGEGVLYLWREIAWQGTAPKPGFKLKTRDVLNAKKAIIDRMNQFFKYIR